MSKKWLSWLEVPGQGNRISAMEGLRAYAAGIVFLLHSALIIAAHFGISLTGHPQSAAAVALQWMANSNHGVDIFFLLSGYLIAGMIRKPEFRFCRYMVQRIARIYPALIAMLVLCTVALYVLRGEVVDPVRFVQNLLLLNGAFGLNIDPINYVTWSVFFEFAFYLTAPLLYRALGLRWTIIIGVVVLAALYQVDTRYIRFLMFLAGMLLRFYPGFSKDIPTWATVGVYLVVTTLAVTTQPLWAFIALFAVAAFLLVDNALHTEGALSKLFSLRPLRLFGNISYSFYLLHPTGLLAARYVMEPLKLEGAPWAVGLIVIGFACSTAIAAVSFVCFERPYFALRRKKAEPLVTEQVPQ